MQKASEGEEVIICKAGKPMAKLIQYNSPLLPRKAGIWKGKITIADDFDDPLPDEALLFCMSKEIIFLHQSVSS